MRKLAARWRGAKKRLHANWQLPEGAIELWTKVVKLQLTDQNSLFKDVIFYSFLQPKHPQSLLKQQPVTHTILVTTAASTLSQAASAASGTDPSLGGLIKTEPSMESLISNQPVSILCILWYCRKLKCCARQTYGQIGLKKQEKHTD